ncbi:DUF3500 domain-containing protein [Phytopseudomonas dryadis]|uniref:DUF3500 domain-containing protein n=1 Tax=Phytopseudomonas dryadis TaxID=2487520 RepID=A0ABY1ZF97_9GAMM|nr:MULTISPECIES: DUF3500 domain-containing protein [Pseudomonas]TBV09316.1 hypothetical protein DNK34_01900 [Pseudomonas dryadis]TBV18704.1 hypothetical protein DNK41_06640 [Pseudomonas sp. FRB 230]
MRKLTCIASALVLAGTTLGSAGWAAESGADVAAPIAAQEQTQAVVAAATGFLDSLAAEQRAQAQFPFTPQKAASAATFARSGPLPGGAGNGGSGGRAGEAGRPSGPRAEGGGPGMGPAGGFVGEQYGAAVWSNYPVSDVPRPGLQLGSLSDAQRAAALRLLQTLLSPQGYQKVLDIMGSDQALSEGGTHYASGTAYYTLGIFGTPSVSAPWMVQFGGHHLGLNVVIVGARGVLTPTLTGAQPSVYTVGDRSVRVLAGENDKAFALLEALDDPQRQQAILDYRVNDLVLGPGRSAETLVPEGLQASAMDERQRALLLDLIGEWAGIVGEAYAAPRMAEIRTGLDDTWFAWSGPTTHEPGRNGSAYYRIQGPRLVIEFSPQGVGGDPTMHVHTVYRDPSNDYGQQFTLP